MLSQTNPALHTLPVASTLGYGGSGRPDRVVEQKLSALAPLTPDEILLLRSLGSRTEQFRPGSQLSAEADPKPKPRFVIAGWAARVRLLDDGRRQIMDILLPGDDTGLQLGRRPGLQSAQTVALTPVRTVDASAVAEIVQREGEAGSPLARACAAASTLEQARLLDHVVRLGQLTAVERLEDALREFQRRHVAAGLAVEGEPFAFPLTQDAMADLLGLSVVHVNRVLQQLRRTGVIELRSGRLRLAPPKSPPVARAAAPARR